MEQKKRRRQEERREAIRSRGEKNGGGSRTGKTKTKSEQGRNEKIMM